MAFVVVAAAVAANGICNLNQNLHANYYFQVQVLPITNIGIHFSRKIRSANCFVLSCLVFSLFVCLLVYFACLIAHVDIRYLGHHIVHYVC